MKKKRQDNPARQKRNPYPHVWRSFWGLIRRIRLPYFWLALAFILSIFGSTLSLLFPNYTSQLMRGDYRLIIVMMVVIMSIGSEFCRLLANATKGVASNKIDRNMQRGAWKKLLQIRVDAIEQENPRYFISRVTTDSTTVSDFLLELLITELPRLYYMVGAVSILYTKYDPLLALTTLTTIPLCFVGTWLTGKLTFKRTDILYSKIAQLTAYLSEKITNLPIIKCYSSEDRESESGKQAIGELLDAKNKSAVVTSFNTTVSSLLGLVPTLTMVITGAVLITRERIDAGSFIAFFQYASTFCGYVMAHISLWSKFKSMQGATYRLSQVMEMEEEARGGSTQPVSGDIVFEDVCFRYGDKTILDHISFTARRGEKTALVGFSGCGKTTTLNLLERFYTPESGTITVGGQDIRQWDTKSYRAGFAYVPQSAPAMQGTIRDVLTYGAKREISEDELQAAISAAHAEEMIEKLGGLDYQVGAGAEKLSGGQRQRLCIARALLADAEYMLLDEATSALDATTAVAIQSALDEKMQGKTMLLVAHNLNTVKNADRIIVLDQGKILAEGTHRQLLSSCPLYAQLVRLQEEGVA